MVLKRFMNHNSYFKRSTFALILMKTKIIQNVNILLWQEKGSEKLSVSSFMYEILPYFQSNILNHLSSLIYNE
jgi:hypothetical protein